MIGPAATAKATRRGDGQEHRQLDRPALDVGGLLVLVRGRYGG